ncbi:MAG: SMI1/KNR4 family protein [Sandaracinaceae bacterium]
MTEILDQVLASSGVVKYAPAHDLGSRMARLPFHLPQLHTDLLARSDGVMGYGGYFRIFGVTDAVVDMVTWNEKASWKFAWPAFLGEFFCFGETAWGDQYAYRLDDLRSNSNPPVYELDAIELVPEQLAEDFTDFLGRIFLRCCREPYDSMLVKARRKIGDLLASEHIIYAPSPLITGGHHLEHVTKMPARAAMVVNGDLATQLATELQTRQIARIEQYADEHGRPRLKVHWAS